MTTSSLDQKKLQLKEGTYIDFTPDQRRLLESAKTDAEFDDIMYNIVEEHNFEWYISEGIPEAAARQQAQMNRKKSGG